MRGTHINLGETYANAAFFIYSSTREKAVIVWLEKYFWAKRRTAPALSGRTRRATECA
jgi:hypothetical protein